ncbi:hypothetical protein, no similarity [Geotrichum candidum]|uniref:Uncharacterized protein n=1 Tax=Geotrichum candidum TaxID=1173061 RepID=A0A0J9XAG3_GEOCN|nr:hypothetical protein, no similarity [Geotrichum candidum]
MLALGGQLYNIAEVPATFGDIWPPGYTSVFQPGALFNLSFMELCEFRTENLSRSSLSPPSLWLLVDANHRLRRQSLSGHAVVLGLAAGPVSHGGFHGDARILLRLDAVAAGKGKLVLCFLFWIMTANLQQA